MWEDIFSYPSVNDLKENACFWTTEQELDRLVENVLNQQWGLNFFNTILQELPHFEVTDLFPGLNWVSKNSNVHDNIRDYLSCLSDEYIITQNILFDDNDKNIGKITIYIIFKKDWIQVTVLGKIDWYSDIKNTGVLTSPKDIKSHLQGILNPKIDI